MAKKRGGKPPESEPGSEPEAVPVLSADPAAVSPPPEPAPSTADVGYPAWVLFVLLLAAASLLYAFERATPVRDRREVVVLVDVPSLSPFLEDTAAIRYLIEAGVSGVVLQPATIGGFLDSSELAIASGAEILRLFRVEGILNIWMWEQFKDKPIRPDATYVFTNQLFLFESLMNSLPARLGKEKVRPYQDKEHDFGGDVPGNYIIEVLASVDEIRSLAVGLDRVARDRLTAGGLWPVIQVADRRDIESLPSTAAVLVEDAEIAAAAFERIRPEAVFLGPGASNPGWPKVLQTRRYSQWKADKSEPAALVVSGTAEVSAAIRDLKAAGFEPRQVRAAEAALEPSWKSAEGDDGRLRIFGWIVVSIACLWLPILPLLEPRPAPLKPAFETRWIASITVLLLVLLTGGETRDMAGKVAVFLGVITPALWLRRLRRAGVPELLPAVAIAVVLLAVELGGAGRASAAPAFVSLLAIALHVVNAPLTRRQLAFLVAGIALASAGIWPKSSPALILSLLAAFSANLLREGVSGVSLSLMLLPAGMMYFARSEESLGRHAMVAALALGLSMLARFYVDRRRLRAPARM